MLYWKGYYRKGERTQNQLLADPEYEPINQNYVVDENLPTKFEFPWRGNRFQPGKVVIPKGRVVALRADQNFAYEEMAQKMLPILTICNGGTAQTITTDTGATYNQAANSPLGIVLNNVYKTVRDTFEFGFPLVARRCTILIPYFGSNASLAGAFNWTCAYDSGGSFTNGGAVMSDGDGKFIPWDGVDQSQVVGKVVSIDRNLPVPLLAWVTVEVVNSLAQFGKLPMAQNQPIYNPYNMIDPSAPSEPLGGNTTTGVPNTNDDYVKPWDMYPNAVSYERGEMSYIFDQKHMFKLLGLPELHDGIEMYKEQVAETILHTDTAKYSYDAADGIVTLTLDHGLIQRDDEGCVNPSAQHPFPSVLRLYDHTTDPGHTNPLVENKDYVVLRQSGKVLVNGDGTHDYYVVYTHLENVKAGILSNLNYAGVIGAIKIHINV